MTLVWLIAIPLAGGVLAWIVQGFGAAWPRRTAVGALVVDLALLLAVWAQHADASLVAPGAWLEQIRAPWIPRFGIGVHLALDGLSLLLVALTLVLGLAAVLASRGEIRERLGFFHFNLLWTLAGVVAVFLAIDLFLFFFAWELMLVPMALLIAIWGHERRTYAAIKFFIFTQASSLLMLIAIVALVFAHRMATGAFTFDYVQLLGTRLDPQVATWLMLGFFLAFAVKLPAIGLHTWLPDAHTEAPTGGSVVLAGVLLKTGAYGMLRFAIPLFPQASAQFAPVAMTLGVIGILYGAWVAFAQTDFKRLVAYTSVSHLGFVLLGIYAWNALALEGAVMQMVAHGISTGALFIVAGMLQTRLHTRDMRRMGGLWAPMPRLGAVALTFAIASLGLPGLGNFVGEVLILLGTFSGHPALGSVAALGLIAAASYALALVQRTFHGPAAQRRASDLSGRELALMSVLIAVVVWLGLHPQPVLDVARPALDGLQLLVPGSAA